MTKPIVLQIGVPSSLIQIGINVGFEIRFTNKQRFPLSSKIAIFERNFMMKLRDKNTE